MDIITNKDYTIRNSDDVTVIQFCSDINVSIIKNVIDDLAKISHCEKRLWDFRGVVFNWSTEDLNTVAEYAMRIFSGSYKAAMVADDTVVFGELRQFQALSNDPEGKKIKVFDNESDGLSWLNS